MRVEVAYATPAKQVILPLELPLGTTIEEAISLSGIKDLFPEIDLHRQGVGVFSIPQNLNYPLKEGERVEIYRELLIDPKEARRRKAKALKSRRVRLK